MHSYLFPLLDVLYHRQVGNLTFWTVRCTELPHAVMAASNHIKVSRYIP